MPIPDFAVPYAAPTPVFLQSVSCLWAVTVELDLTNIRKSSAVGFSKLLAVHMMYENLQRMQFHPMTCQLQCLDARDAILPCRRKAQTSELTPTPY